MAGTKYLLTSSKIVYGKSVSTLGLFIGFRDPFVKTALISMRNSDVESQEISAFRKITNSLFVVRNCRYESLRCDDRFVMKQKPLVMKAIKSTVFAAAFFASTTISAQSSTPFTGNEIDSTQLNKTENFPDKT